MKYEMASLQLGTVTAPCTNSRKRGSELAKAGAITKPGMQHFKVKLKKAALTLIGIKLTRLSAVANRIAPVRILTFFIKHGDPNNSVTREID